MSDMFGYITENHEVVFWIGTNCDVSFLCNVSDVDAVWCLIVWDVTGGPCTTECDQLSWVILVPQRRDPCDQQAVARWEKDFLKFPLYHYLWQNGLKERRPGGAPTQMKENVS